MLWSLLGIALVVVGFWMLLNPNEQCKESLLWFLTYVVVLVVGLTLAIGPLVFWLAARS